MTVAQLVEDHPYETLNLAILKAISSSQDVKNVLHDFQKKNLIDKLSVLNLILSLDELEEALTPETEQAEEAKAS